MKVLQLVDTLSVGGTERMAVNISNVLSKDGIPNKLLVSRKGGGLQNQIENPNNLFFLNKKNFFDLAAFSRLVKSIKDFKPTVVHAHSSSIYWAVLAKLITKVDFILIFHDHFGKSEFLKEGDRSVLIKVSKWIDAVIVVNDQLRIWNQQNLNLKKNSIILLNNFPYLAINSSTRKTEGELKILHLANFRPQKDHLTFINALNLIKNRNPEINFKIYFVGLHSNDSYFQEVKKALEDFNLIPYILHLGPSDKVEDFLMDSDIGVLSSTSEGLPVSLLEYGLAQLQIVSTDVGQIRKVLDNGKYGDLVPPKSPELFANALLKAFEKAKFSQNSAFKSFVEENFGASLFISSYKSFIQSIA
ncbi:MAG: glycosyltransferase [Algoriphagus sp.]|uniref:glycosyltransferase n=1 Tax=Algoriphagus sp. TaxID=1872435 RepID=UPI00260DA72C|nr:glycosyltransferase [Algoriphagus sp.]MDG1275692.1 glycosyltransferase [Algoriphagus sp.]